MQETTAAEVASTHTGNEAATTDIESFVQGVVSGDGTSAQTSHRWQHCITGVFIYMHFWLPYTTMSIIFVGSPTNYTCANHTSGPRRATIEAMWRIEEPENPQQQCTQPCAKWDFSNTDSVIAEWSLVCARAWLLPLLQTLVMAGATLGALGTALLGDTVGRYALVLVGTGTHLVAGLTCVLANTYWVYATARLLKGVSVGCLLQQTIALEMLDTRQRTVYALLSALGFSAGTIAMATIHTCWLHSWRALEAASLVCFAPIVVVAVWLVPESPRWLIVSGRELRAARTLLAGARFNRQPCRQMEQLVAEIRDIGRHHQQQQQAADAHHSVCSVWHKLFCSGHALSRHIWIVFYMHACVCLLYYSISLSFSTQLGTSVYTATVLGAAVELPSLLLFGCLHRCGRRHTQSACFLTLALLYVLRHLDTAQHVSLAPLWLCVYAGQRFAVHLAFIAVALHAAELAPTQVRATALGLAAVFTRLGGCLSPFLETLAGSTHTALTDTLAAVCVLAAGLVLTLPETGHQRLADAVEERRALLSNQ